MEEIEEAVENVEEEKHVEEKNAHPVVSKRKKVFDIPKEIRKAAKNDENQKKTLELEISKDVSPNGKPTNLRNPSALRNDKSHIISSTTFTPWADLTNNIKPPIPDTWGSENVEPTVPSIDDSNKHTLTDVPYSRDKKKWLGSARVSQRSRNAKPHATPLRSTEFSKSSMSHATPVITEPNASVSPEEKFLELNRLQKKETSSKVTREPGRTESTESTDVVTVDEFDKLAPFFRPEKKRVSYEAAVSYAPSPGLTKRESSVRENSQLILPTMKRNDKRVSKKDLSENGVQLRKRDRTGPPVATSEPESSRVLDISNGSSESKLVLLMSDRKRESRNLATEESTKDIHFAKKEEPTAGPSRNGRQNDELTFISRTPRITLADAERSLTEVKKIVANAPLDVEEETGESFNLEDKFKMEPLFSDFSLGGMRRKKSPSQKQNVVAKVFKENVERSEYKYDRNGKTDVAHAGTSKDSVPNALVNLSEIPKEVSEEPDPQDLIKDVDFSGVVITEDSENNRESKLADVSEEASEQLDHIYEPAENTDIISIDTIEDSASDTESEILEVPTNLSQRFDSNYDFTSNVDVTAVDASKNFTSNDQSDLSDRLSGDVNEIFEGAEIQPRQSELFESKRKGGDNLSHENTHDLQRNCSLISKQRDVAERDIIILSDFSIIPSSRRLLERLGALVDEILLPLPVLPLRKQNSLYSIAKEKFSFNSLVRAILQQICGTIGVNFLSASRHFFHSEQTNIDLPNYPTFYVYNHDLRPLVLPIVENLVKPIFDTLRNDWTTQECGKMGPAIIFMKSFYPAHFDHVERNLCKKATVLIESACTGAIRMFVPRFTIFNGIIFNMANAIDFRASEGTALELLCLTDMKLDPLPILKTNNIIHPINIKEVLLDIIHCVVGNTVSSEGMHILLNPTNTPMKFVQVRDNFGRRSFIDMLRTHTIMTLLSCLLGCNVWAMLYRKIRDSSRPFSSTVNQEENGDQEMRELVSCYL